MIDLCKHLTRECTGWIDEHEIGGGGVRVVEWTCIRCGEIEHDLVELPPKRMRAI